MADQEELIRNSKPLVAEIERMSDRISRLPSPSDKEPFDHIVLSDFRSVEHAVANLKVDQLPTVYYLVPCTGNVCGGSNIRLEGHNLSGEDVTVWIGGVVCEHVTSRSPGGGTTVSCVLPPCQGELEVDVIVEVNGRPAFGDSRFLYSTPAPFIQHSSAVVSPPAYASNAIVIPIKGAGFASIAALNQAGMPTHPSLSRTADVESLLTIENGRRWICDPWKIILGSLALGFHTRLSRHTTKCSRSLFQSTTWSQGCLFSVRSKSLA